MRERAMELKFSKVERKGPITIVTLSRPEVYNALHTEAHFELQKVFDEFAADAEQWVAIVTGSGDKAISAAVNGVAMGGGFEIALACDLIIAAEYAIFAMPETLVFFSALAGGLH